MSDFKEQIAAMVPDVLIHTVTFDHQDGVVEITYAELRDQAGGVGMMKIIALERELFNTEVAELESDLRDLIDEAGLAIRNDDARQRRIDRAMARAPGAADPEEEDEDE